MSTDPRTTYLRYKTANGKLVRWLTIHARLRSSRGSSSSSETPEASNTKISTHELVPWAHSIAAANIDIPLEIIYILKDIIAGRQECLNWYHKLARNNNVDPAVLISNRTHKYFLSRMQQVHNILMAAYQVSHPKSKHSNTKLDTNLEKMKNSFEYLHVEDPAEGEGEESSEVNLRSKANISKEAEHESSEYNLDDGNEEKSFAIFCLFQDFAALHEQICQIWAEYKNGDLSFMTTCILTNTAFDFYLNAAEEFSQAHADLRSFEDILEFSGMSGYLTKARIAQYHICNRNDDGVNLTKSGIHNDLLCMKAWTALRDVKDISPWLLTTDAERQRVGSPRVRHSGPPFNKLLIGVAKELVQPIADICSSLDLAAHNLDEFTLRLIQYMTSPGDGAMPIGLAGMTSAYIGIYDTLDGDMEQGLLESNRVLDRIHDAAADYRGYLEGIGIGHGEIEGMLGCTRKTSDHLEFRVNCSIDQPGLQLSKRLLGALPILCGTHAVKMSERSHLFGLSCFSSNTFLLTLAHLYKASREHGLLTSDWPLMEFIINNQMKVKRIERTRKTFCGEINPNSHMPALSRARQFVMSLGIPLEKACRATPADHPDISPISLAINPVSTSHFLAATEHIAKRKERLGQAPKMIELHYDVVRRLLKSGEPIRDPIIAEEWQRSKSLTDAQMLTVLQQAILVSEQDINTDYLGLSKICTTLLKDFQKLAIIKSTVDVSMLHSSTALVAFTLWQAAQHEQSIHQRRPSQRCELLLSKAAQLIERVLETGSDDLCGSSLEVTSGSIAERLKPAVLYPAGRLKQFGIVDFGGITFAKSKVQESAEEKQLAFDAKAGKVAKIVEEFQEQNGSLRSGDDVAEQMQRLREELEKKLFDAKCLSKSQVSLVDGRLAFSARDITDSELRDMVNNLTARRLIEIMKTGVHFGED